MLSIAKQWSGAHSDPSLMPLTISELLASSPKSLRNGCIERLRFPRGMQILRRRRWVGMRLGCFNKRVTILLFMAAWTALVDDYVDGDLRSRFKSTWHLNHVGQVLDALRPTSNNLDDDDSLVMIYDWWIVASAKLADEIGRPILDEYIRLWEYYLVDAKSVINKDRFPSQETLQASNEHAARLFAIAFYVLGVDFDKALELTQAFMPTLLRTFVLWSIPAGIARFESKVTREELESSGVDTKELLELLDGGELGKRDEMAAWARMSKHKPFISWYRSEAAHVQADWTKNGHSAFLRLGQLVPAPYGWLARRMLASYLKQVKNLQERTVKRFAASATS